MKRVSVVFALLLGFAASSEVCRSLGAHVKGYISDRIARGSGGNDPGPRLVQDFLNEILEKIQGENVLHDLELEIDEKNRFRNVYLHSVVGKTFLDMREKDLRLIDIRNLTIPLHALILRGLYEFEDLALPGGLSLYGSGNFAISILDLRASLSVRVEYSMATGRLEVGNLYADASMSNSTITFENLMDGEPLGEFLNEMMNGLFQIGVELVHDFVEEFKDEIKRELEKIINSLFYDRAGAMECKASLSRGTPCRGETSRQPNLRE